MNMSKRNFIRAACATLIAAAIYVPIHSYVLREKAPAPSSSSGEPSPHQDPAQNSDHERKVLQSQLEKKPGHVPVLLRMAELAREAGKPAEAVKHLREAVGAEPGNQEARLELGRALYESGDPQAAIRETSQILKSNPNDTDALYNLGAIYANVGDFSNAVKHWQDAIQAGAESESGKRAKESLTQITRTVQVSGPNPHANGMPVKANAGDPIDGVSDFIQSVAARPRSVAPSRR